MSQSELNRLDVVTRVNGGLMTAVEAAALLGLSERQLRRILAAYRQEGAAALAHGNRGRKPANAVSEETRQKVVELATTRYVGYNHQHLSEVIEREGIELSRSSVRRILVPAGLKSPRKRRAPKHRSRRERYAQEGMLVQIDGSPHDWLEGRGPRLTLHAGIDDATGKIVGGKFRLQEDAVGYIELMRRIVARHGIPLAVYHDRHDIFVVPTNQEEGIEEQLAGERTPTQVGRVFAELGVRSIKALSPQAKGRVERLFGTLQDRLTKALRESAATTVEKADRVLEGFIEEFNQKFAVEPAESGLAYRSLPKGFEPEEVFCFKYLRVVAADNTVSFFGRHLHIRKTQTRVSYAKARVEVHERLDGSLAVYHEGALLVTEPAPKDAKTLRARHGPRPKPKSLNGASPANSAVGSTTGNVWETRRKAEESKSDETESAIAPTTTDPTQEPTRTELAAPEERSAPPPATSHTNKWTGERISRPSKPASNHPWRTPIKRPTVTESLNA